jgi:DNA-binding protein H-NS
MTPPGRNVAFKGIDFSLLTDPQLLELWRTLELEIAERRAEGRRLARARRRIREGEGPRYRNPRNPAQTWSGRGPRPRWVRELTTHGALLSDLEIEDNRPIEPDFDSDFEP